MPDPTEEIARLRKERDELATEIDENLHPQIGRLEAALLRVRSERDALRQRVKELEGLLRKYGKHSNDCDGGPQTKCWGNTGLFIYT